jgi:hypothetical protein
LRSAIPFAPPPPAFDSAAFLAANSRARLIFDAFELQRIAAKQRVALRVAGRRTEGHVRRERARHE